jgi:hypothetical protein
MEIRVCNLGNSISRQEGKTNRKECRLQECGSVSRRKNVVAGCQEEICCERYYALFIIRVAKNMEYNVKIEGILGQLGR